ncbi:hypothetical protein WJM97_16405 [Okeanomitos corallinicola TIOX110]|uniref:Uncharacterized protein n=1 Tax=Okeanomitos corallinicola TIOX110 TaxID=3133117 RepID=A0ABZ2UPR5_9CYAN
MTNNNIESSAIVEVNSQTSDIVETEMVGETDEVKNATKALIEAIKKRAQAEAESAGTLTRDTYLNAVRQAKETIEGEKLIERDRLETAWKTIQEETEKNWHSLFHDISTLGNRFQDAAKAAWDTFNAPRN